MADTIRSSADVIAMLPNNTTGEISEQDMRDFAVSAYAWAGGAPSIKDSTGILGDGTSSQQSLLDGIFYGTGALGSVPKSVPTGTYKYGNASGNAITNALHLVGVDPYLSKFTHGTLASGAIMYSPEASMRFKNVGFGTGGRWFSFPNLATGAGPITMDNVVFDGADRAFSNASGTVPSGYNLHDLRIRNSEFLNCANGGLYLNGGAAKNVQVLNTYFEGCGKFSSIVGNARWLTGQMLGTSDHLQFGNIMIRGHAHVGASGSVNNAFYTSGRYVQVTNLMVVDTTGGTASESNFEPVYSKNAYATLVNIMVKNGGFGDGQIDLKGNARPAKDGSTDEDSPCGHNNILLGWQVIRNDASSTHYLPTPALVYNSGSAVWLQVHDAIIMGGMTDRINGPAFRVHEGGTSAPDGHKNLGIYFNHSVEHSGTCALIRAGHYNTRVIGNLFEVTTTSAVTGIRYETLSIRDAHNYVCALNTIHLKAEPTGTYSAIHIDSDDNEFHGALVAMNLIDGEGVGATQDKVYGLLFAGAAAINECLVANNVFRNIPDLDQVIASFKSTGLSTYRITDNIGFPNDNVITGTVSAAATSLTFSHGLPTAQGFDNKPSPSDIHLVWKETPVGITGWWIAPADITSTQVTIRFIGDPDNDVDYEVHVRKTLWTEN